MKNALIKKEQPNDEELCSDEGTSLRCLSVSLNGKRGLRGARTHARMTSATIALAALAKAPPVVAVGVGGGGTRAPRDSQGLS